MSLSPGDRIGPYVIADALGAGGMGEVYRARDTRLNRDVAIKVLPDAFAADPERRDRFEREAQAIAALSHPNILAIHDVGFDQGRAYAVTELLDGETLRERIRAGAIPVSKAIDIAVQIARGLSAAHDKGFVHRDVKPENIFLVKDGRVKILDFGLVRTTEVPTDASETMAVTHSGALMGTVGYMAPEQIRDQDVDTRADLFALGAVLYEMLSGQRAFKADTTTDTLFAIVKDDPLDLVTMRGGLPSGLDRITRHCLEKNPAERFQSARDVAFALEQLSGSTSTAVVGSVPTARRQPVLLPWVVAAAVTMATGVIVFLRLPQIQPSGADPVLWSVVIPPILWSPELSPNGRRLASTGVIQGKQVVWVREMDSLNVTTLTGSDEAIGMFWYPDSQSVGILSQRKLQRVPLTSDPPQVIKTGLGTDFAGAAANRQGIVLHTMGTGRGPLYRTSPDGESTAATALDSARDETAHAWPQFLPDDTHFIYLAISRKPEYSGIYLGSTESAETRLILKTDVRAQFVLPGFLVFVRDNALMAQRFDANTQELTGTAQSLASSVATFSSMGSAAMTVSPTAIAYLESGPFIMRNSQLRWMDRDGNPIGTIGDIGDYMAINLSRDQSKLAISLQNTTTKSFDVWKGDVQRGNTTPFLVSPSGEFDPQWGPNDEIAFSSDRNGPMAIFKWNGAGEPVEVERAAEAVYLSDWSRDGRFILYQTWTGKVYAKPVTGEAARKILDSPSYKDELRFSPDLEWIAYNANDDGRFQVYVVSFREPGQPKPVSVNGGVQPRWRRDGKEIFYLAPDGTMMAVAVQYAGSSIEFSVPQALFRTRLSNPSSELEQFDVSADGQRFIVITPPDDAAGQRMNLLINWTARLK